MTQPSPKDVMARLRDAAANLVDPPLHLLKGEFLRRKRSRDEEMAALERQTKQLEQEALAAATRILTRHQVYVHRIPNTYQDAVQQLLEHHHEQQ